MNWFRTSLLEDRGTCMSYLFQKPKVALEQVQELLTCGMGLDHTVALSQWTESQLLSESYCR